MRIKRNITYVYLLHYKFINGGNEARCVLTRTKPIKTLEHVEQIENYIKEKLTNNNGLAIVSYQLMSVK